MSLSAISPSSTDRHGPPFFSLSPFMWTEFNGGTVLRAAGSATADVHVDGDGHIYNKFREEACITTNAGPGQPGGLELAAVVTSVIFTATQALSGQSNVLACLFSPCCVISISVIKTPSVV